jgi:hypothetical protein
MGAVRCADAYRLRVRFAYRLQVMGMEHCRKQHSDHYSRQLFIRDLELLFPAIY